MSEDIKLAIERAVKESSRTATKVAILCAVPSAVAGAVLYLAGVNVFVMMGAQYLASWVTYRAWRRRYEQRQPTIAPPVEDAQDGER